MQRKFDKLVNLHNKLITDVSKERDEYNSNREKYDKYDAKMAKLEKENSRLESNC